MVEIERSSVQEVFKKLNIPERTVRGWRNERLKLEEQNRTYKLSDTTKRIRTSVLDDLEEALYVWFSWSVKSGIPMTGPLIQAKALELFTELEIEKKFSASSGWLNYWKKKYNVKSYSICGEKMSADIAGAQLFKEEFDEELSAEEEYQLCQIFNADETGLNYKMMLRRTLAEKSTNISGLKQNKERVTVMTCSNADGGLKLPLVVIGKAARPRAIKDIPKTSLHVYYAGQRSAWMSCQIFEDWYKAEFVPRVTEFLK